MSSTGSAKQKCGLLWNYCLGFALHKAGSLFVQPFRAAIYKNGSLKLLSVEIIARDKNCRRKSLEISTDLIKLLYKLLRVFFFLPSHSLHTRKKMTTMHFTFYYYMHSYREA